ncbi:hypothetical protein D3C72_2538410 [compost metagenome]
METLGKVCTELMANFSLVSSLVTTAPLFISLPVAARVRMANTGSAASICPLPMNRSQTSP